MAIKELFYDNRPQVLLDPRASQRIDPRFKFTRNSIGTHVNREKYIAIAQPNEPRFNYDSETGEFYGLLNESVATNSVTNSAAGNPILDDGIGSASIVTNVVTPYGDLSGCRNIVHSSTPTPGYYRVGGSVNITQGVQYTVSCFVRNPNNHPFEQSPSGILLGLHLYRFGTGQSQTFGFGNSAVKKERFPNYWTRYSATFTAQKTATVDGFFSISLDFASYLNWNYQLWGFQIEKNPYSTSYIPTSGIAVTRDADLLSIESPLPASGSVYIDARAITANENDTLLSLKNDSNDKIDLAYLSNTSTYDSLALIANYDGTSKTSLPLPVPTTDRERNIITWGAQNYQYGRDSSRFATSLSSSVPTGLNQLSIGHDAVDPTKAFKGYINTVYVWSGELTPAVAEALVRNDLTPINADTYSPTGPAGSLALVINTQGTTASGEKTFTLPAESAANDNDIVITWGDGTESGLDGSDAELGASGLTHTYPAAGIYPVWVEGQMENIRFNNIANAKDVLQIAAWGTGDMFTAPSTMQNAFLGCTQMDFSSSARNTNLPDTSAVQDWSQAFYNCSSITGTFPAFNFSAATNFTRTWRGCSTLTAFAAAGDQTQNVTNFTQAWQDCSSLTSFPLINTSAGTTFAGAWLGCSGLTSFPLINTAASTSFSEAWYNCSGLTSFPLINTAAGANFGSAWFGCSSLTSFPLINTAAGTSFSSAWFGCSSLTSFPLIDTSSGTSFSATWRDCSGLTSFPLINTAAGTNFSSAWSGCSSLTSFPLINTAAGTSFQSTWFGCSSLTSFPLINTAAGTSFQSTWSGCSSLTSFPANFFDSWTGTPGNKCFYGTWDNCSSLTPASVVNILDSIAASGQSAPSGTDTGDKEITIDWDGTGDPATDAATAITTLKSRNWDVVLNGVSQ